MKVEIHIIPDTTEPVAKIYCNQYGPEIKQIQKYLEQQEMSASQTFIGYQQDVEYYLPSQDILFFETLDEVVYAHTNTSEYVIKQRLYEVEKTLSHEFIRISKSTLLNLRMLFAIEPKLGGPHKILLQNSQKIVYASRKYYPLLKQKLKERL